MDTVKELAQWSLAFVLVGAGVAYSLLALVTGKAPSGPPDWLSVAIGTAIGYYFGQRTQQTTMEGISNGVTTMMSKMAGTQQPAVAEAPPAPTPGPQP